MGHKWIKNEGSKEVDIFAAENMPSDFHNGPKCAKCSFEFCHHCNPEGYETQCGAKSIQANPENTKKGELLHNSFKI